MAIVGIATIRERGPAWPQTQQFPRRNRTINWWQRPAAAHEKLIRRLAGRLSTTVLLVLVILAGLPVAVWLDMRNLSEQALLDQADDLTSMINNIRNYYATNVVERVLAGGERTQVLPNYSAVPGAIPIPATLSLELGDVINRENGNVRFRFFSDHPFKNRAPHAFDAFEREALETLRQDPSARLHRASARSSTAASS